MKSTSSLVLAGLIVALGAIASAATVQADATPRDSSGQYIDDASITTKVKVALLNDAAVKSFEIHVATYRGVVHLSGTVDNSDQKAAAQNDAASVPGVQSVTNNITVKE